MKTEAVINNEMLKSIINEFINYHYWQMQYVITREKMEKLNTRLYEVSGVSYDKIPQQNAGTDYETKILEIITRKNMLEEKLERIKRNEIFVNRMLELMDEDDCYFIKRALIQRRERDTNDSIAMKFEITESGVRYKINTIVKKTFLKYLDFTEIEEGGVVESTTM